MGSISAVKLKVIENVQRILSIELLVASQALHLDLKEKHLLTNKFAE